MSLINIKDLQTIFEKNKAVLDKVNPQVSEAIVNHRKGASLEVVYGKNNLPSLRINNITLHSLYNSEKEAVLWVQQHEKEIKNASSIIVFGFGLGYHLLQLCKSTGKEITVFEPSVDILKAALKTVDLTSILSKIKILINDKIPYYENNIAVLQHKPSVNLNKEFFKNVQAKLKSHGYIHNGLKILVVTPLYGGSLPIAKYCSSALKKMGHDVELIDNSRFAHVLFYVRDISKNSSQYSRLMDIFSEFLSEIIMTRCEAFKPDLVFALAQAPLTESSLIKLRQHRIPTAYWFVEDFRVMGYWKRIARYYDYFFTIQKGEFFEKLKKEEVKNFYYLPIAASPDVHKPKKLSEEEKNYYGSDISFVGAGYYNRRHFLKGLLDFDFKIWGTDWDMNSALAKYVQRAGARIDTDEVVKIFNATKININLHSSTYHKGINPFGDFVNPRTFEIIACGGFQLVDRRLCLGELFKINNEIVIFDNLEDLRNKITYYLNNPEEREIIIQKGRERILREHTYDNRMQAMLAFIAEKGYVQPLWIEKGESVEGLIEESGRETELGKFLSQFTKKSKVTLSDIVEEIKNAEGDISKTETLLLAMSEFVK